MSLQGKKRQAVLLTLIEAMIKEDSWAGETHVQKCCYFLQEALGVPLEFEFILYKHGPFSFDLRDELEQMVADLIILYKPQYPYGPSMTPGETADRVKERFPRTIKTWRTKVEFVAKRVSTHDVSWLERVGTALFVLREDQLSDEQAVSKVNELKPHISLDLARTALREVKKILGEASAL